MTNETLAMVVSNFAAAIAGTSVLIYRLERIERDISRIVSSLEKKVEKQELDQVRDKLSKLEVLHDLSQRSA